MMNRRPSLLAVLAALAVLLASPLYAANTVFLTDPNGQVAFPISPPNRANSTPGAIDNMNIGAATPAPGKFTTLQATSITNTSATPITQGAPVAHDTAATLAAADFSAGIITSNPSGAINLQLPLGTAMDTAFPAAVTNSSIDFSVISIAGSTNLPTITVNTGFTIVGSAIFTAVAGNAGRFRARKTGTATWVLYRLS